MTQTNLFDADVVARELSIVGYMHIPALPPEFDFVRALSSLGTPVSQYHGGIVRDIRPEPDMSDEVYSASNTKELVPHTEWYEFPGNPPKYVALWCVRPAEDPGGATQLGDGHRFLEEFTAEERTHLYTQRFRWRSSVSLEQRGIKTSSESPVLAEHRGEVVMRFSSGDMIPTGDALQERYVKEGNRFFYENALDFRLERGSLLIWNNWRMMHSRTKFRDRRRHLQRVLLAVD